MSVLPSAPDEASVFYHGQAGRDYHEHKRHLRPACLEWVMKLRAEKFQKFIRQQDAVCELGSGAGWNLGRLKCARRLAVDASDFLREPLTKLGIDYVEQIQQVPDASIDVAICHHTLEHLLEPAAALRQLFRILKPGGKLILHVPWEYERRHAAFKTTNRDHHLYTWNAQNLGNLVFVLGGQIERVSVRRYGYDRFAANTAARLKLGPRGFWFLRSLLLSLRPLREVELVCYRRFS